MAVDDDRYKDASPELREIWDNPRVNRDVLKRADELAEQGRWEERAQMLADDLFSREDLIQSVRESMEAYKRGEIKFRTPPHDPSG